MSINDSLEHNLCVMSKLISTVFSGYGFYLCVFEFGEYKGQLKRQEMNYVSNADIRDVKDAMKALVELIESGEFIQKSGIH